MRQRLEQVKLDTATAASNVIASKARKANLEAVMEKLKVGSLPCTCKISIVAQRCSFVLLKRTKLC